MVWGAILGGIMKAVTVAATVYSAYTAVKGLKEGNIGQAVLGAVGAWAGYSALSSGGGGLFDTGSQSQSANALKQGVENNQASVLFGEQTTVNPDMSPVTNNLTDPISKIGEGIGASGIDKLPSTSINQIAASNPTDLMAQFNQVGKSTAIPNTPNPGIELIGGNQPQKSLYDHLKEAMGVVNNNQTAAGGLMQLYGGYQDREFMQDQLDKNSERQERSYINRQTPSSVRRKTYLRNV